MASQMRVFGAIFVVLAGGLCASPATAQEAMSLPGPPPRAPAGFAAVLKPSPYGGYWVLLPIPMSPPAAGDDIGEPALPPLDSPAPRWTSPPAADAPLPEAELTGEPDMDAMMLERSIIDAVNERRIAAGLAPLQPHPQLTTAAREHSEEMARLGYFDHESPTPERSHFTDRLRLAGITDPGKAGENLQKAPAELIRQPTDRAADTFAQSWMDSKGHRDNILDGEFTFTGVGVIATEQGVWATQVFASRLGPADAIEPPMDGTESLDDQPPPLPLPNERTLHERE